jgi:polysaccharide biosynthesis protein PslH
VESMLRRRVNNESFDLVIASQWMTAAYWRAFVQTPAIYEEVELGVFEAKRENARGVLSRLRHQVTLLKLRAYLPRLLSHYQACTVVSDVEHRLLHALSGGYPNVVEVPNCFDVGSYPPADVGQREPVLIFTGSFRYFANYDAMCWFVEEVYPRIRARAPGVRLVITGDSGGHTLPDAPNVTLTGLVPDVRPLLGAAAVSIAPVRVGGGTRLKVLEAMASGTPVVGTVKAVEGLDVRDGEHVLVSDSAEGFADAVLALLHNPTLSRQIAAGARNLVEQRYDWKRASASFLTLVERVGSTAGPARPAAGVQAAAGRGL